MADNLRTRREVFGAAGSVAGVAGGAGLVLLAGASNAATPVMSEAEKANLKLVNDFCAAWPTDDPAKIMPFFSDNPAYRQTEKVAPAVGRQAVADMIAGLQKVVLKFQVHDSWARGPMVINERTDTFTGGRLKSWHGVGVFLVKDGKIVEWYDYTIELHLV